jgi:type II secretory pathway pseudopilin PulG
MKKNGGYSLVEIVIAAVIFGIVASASMKAFMFISKQSVKVDERAYAVQKAIQMMEELRSLVQQQGAVIGVLDDYDNGSNYKYTLSTLSEVNGANNAQHVNDNPADPISGNSENSTYNSGKYKRKITVERTNESLSRRVFVRVYRSSDGELLAETASVLRTLPPNFVPTQVYDVYVLTLENVPGWWVALSTLAPTFGTIVQDLQNRNPGLNLNVHYITRLAYGRDPYYRPYVNTATRSDTTASPWVYFLPGNINGSFTYYTASSINGNINDDGTPTSNDGIYPYSLADQYNHAVRQPDEERMYAEARSAYAAAGQQTMPEPSFRMLLDRMNAGTGTENDGTPYDYRNAIIINLHGELMPLPPVRNYSDAAKRPTAGTAAERKWRVVTHPERLRYDAGNAFKLRVYPFVSDPEDANFPDDNTGAYSTIPDVTVMIVSTQVTSSTAFAAANMTIRKMVGSSTTTYAWSTTTSGSDYTLTYPTTYQTLITLKNSPVRHSEYNTDHTGLNEAAADRLYGLEYIPCLVQNTASFAEATKDLQDPTNNVPKNTARWTIAVANAAALPNGTYTIETRIGTDLTTGVSTEPANLSRTYAWIGASSTVPMSERYQVLGDPRHCPYADIKSQHKFNWWFRSDIVAADYPGFLWDDNATAVQEAFGPSGDAMDIMEDVPRLFEMVRKGLLNTTSLLSSVTGWSFYYIGFGGEMGADSNNGFGSGLPIIGTPWTPNSTASANIDEISKWASNSYQRIIAHSTDGTADHTNWFSLNWIGELYPDEAASVWVANGNLPTGNTFAGDNWKDRRYFRAPFYISDTAAAANYGLNMYSQNLDTVFPNISPMKQPGPNGSGSFFNGQPSGAPTAYFNHAGPSNTATLTSSGTAVSQDFNFPLPSPLTSSGNNHRPFLINQTGTAPAERNQSSYVAQRSTISYVETYYDSSNAGYATSALI